MLAVRDLCIAYNNDPVLRVNELHLKTGEIACILGPSGSGKSSFLHALCGLHTPVSGCVELKQGKVFDQQKNVASADRKIAMVFQDLSLFPHMTVQQNVAYGLHTLSKAEQAQRVSEVLSLVELDSLAHRYPYELSGGQQQRVAIARAVAPQSEVLLMDEPFSSLDPSLREQLAFDLRVLLKKLGITALIVTHDQQEAFAMADKIAVFSEGVCQQWGSAYELYHQPANIEVASFIGEGAFLQGKVVNNDGQKLVETALARLAIPESSSEKNEKLKHGQPVKVLVRPDDILHRDHSEHKAIVVQRQFRGAHIMYTLALANSEEVLCLAPSHHDHQVGEAFGIQLDVQHMVVFS
ncbi:ABC transporter ATP-binding protein [Agaribacter flavus]|uniref:ABC transporter ATP-binding protein n=1 Tax=Agaribacter flavus TaxID=1902781 RepID=A0ABV7FQP8_9ALTE